MSLAKIAIVVGAGIVGSIVTSEGHFYGITDIFSSALRVVTRHLQQDKVNSHSSSNPRNDSLLSQVNSLRHELQLIQSSRSVTIITGSRSDSRAHGVATVIVFGVAGFVFIKWKGWKISDMMFVTLRSFSDACAAVGRQVDLVSSSITTAKRHLSSRIDRVDANVDECKEIAYETKGEVSELHGKLSSFHSEVASVHHFVKTLESKLERIEEKQEVSILGVYRLCNFAEDFERRRSAQLIQSSPSSRQAIELSPAAGIVTRTGSLSSGAIEAPSSMPSPVALEETLSLPAPYIVSKSPEVPQSSRGISASGLKVLRSSSAISASGLKELQEISAPVRSLSSTLRTNLECICEVPNRTPSSENQMGSEPNSNRSGWKLPGLSILTRSRSKATS